MIFQNADRTVIITNDRDLKYFNELVKQKNFSKVAQKMGVSQPTVTNAIKRLEYEFSAHFFIRDRSHKELIITNAGELFAKHVQNILNELERAQNEINHAQQQQIFFGLPPIIGNYYFPRLTPQLMDANLLTDLHVVETGSSALLQLLAHSEIDVGLLGSLSPLQDRRLSAQIIRKYPINIIVAKNHPLAKLAGQGICFQDLAKEKFISFDESYVHNQAFKTMCSRNRIRPHVVYRSNDVHIIKSLVAENIGIAYLTSLAVLSDDNLIQLPIVDENPPEFLISAVRNRVGTISPQYQQLWQLLTQFSWVSNLIMEKSKIYSFYL